MPKSLKLKSDKIFIYGLCDPRSGHLRSIGKSPFPDARLLSHMREAIVADYRFGGNPAKGEWISNLIEHDLVPEVFVIEECKSGSWKESERFWIQYFRSIGCELLNIRGMPKPVLKKEPKTSSKRERATSAEKLRLENVVRLSRFETERRAVNENNAQEIARLFMKLPWEQQLIVEAIIKQFLGLPSSR